MIEHKSGYYYIGKSVDWFNRLAAHYTQLKMNKHHAKDLQKLWNESDIVDWNFKILEQVSKTYVREYSKLKGKELDKLYNRILLDKEKEYMKMYSINFCLNGDKHNFS